MEDRLNEWLAEVDGKPIEAEDASNYAQCFDLAFSWCDKLGIPRDSIRHLYAYQIFTNPNPDTGQYWDVVGNTPSGVPPIGSLVIWGTSISRAGHVAIFKEGDQNSFRSEDENWAGIQLAKQVNHSYSGVLGWLVPKITVVTPVEPAMNDQTLIPANLLNSERFPLTADAEIQQIRGWLGDGAVAKTDLDNTQIELNKTKSMLDNYTLANNQQKTMLDAYAKQITELQNQVITLQANATNTGDNVLTKFVQFIVRAVKGTPPQA